MNLSLNVRTTQYNVIINYNYLIYIICRWILLIYLITIEAKLIDSYYLLKSQNHPSKKKFWYLLQSVVK